MHSGLARQVSSLLTNHLARATECCGNQAAGNDALQDVLSLLNDLSRYSTYDNYITHTKRIHIHIVCVFLIHVLYVNAHVSMFTFIIWFFFVFQEPHRKSYFEPTSLCFKALVSAT